MDHAALIDRFYAAYAARDAAGAAALYHPDGWHDEVAMAKRRSGHQALAAGLEGFWRMLPDVAWHRTGYVRSGTQVAVPYRMTGTFTGKDGMARSIALDGLHLFHLRDGALEGTADLWDLDLFKAQMAG